MVDANRGKVHCCVDSSLRCRFSQEGLAHHPRFCMAGREYLPFSIRHVAPTRVNTYAPSHNMKAGHSGLSVAARQAQEDTSSTDQGDCPSSRGFPGAWEDCL